MALVPIYNVLEIVLDYLANDPELYKVFAYFHSKEFPKIHTIFEHLKEYKEVSAFMYMFLKPQSDRENMCSVSAGV
jgi:hypothetical protein